MEFTILKDMYAMLWEFIYKLAEYFGWEISNPYEDAE